MAERMPTEVELEQAFGAASAGATTRTTLEQLRNEERRGRLMRDAKVEENCVVQAQFVATYKSTSAESGQVVSEWIDFGRIKFTERPALLGGSFRLAQNGEPELSEDASNYDPDVHISVPCVPMGLKWRQDPNGYYTGARVLAFALAAVEDGYRALVSVAFVGPAIRMA
jgi:hypothetical protein